jgi:hypothetical protein
MKDFPLIRSPRSALIAAAAISVPLLLFSFVFGWLYVPLLVLIFVPAALCLTMAVSGSLPALIGEAAAIGAMGLVFGARGALLAAVYTLPILLCFTVAVQRRVPFKKGCFALMGIHLAALAVCFVLIRGWTGGDPYTAAAEAAKNALTQWEMGDLMLYQMYALGLVELPKGMQGATLTPMMDGFALELSDAARQDLLLSLAARIKDGLFSITPSLIVSQSILGGISCLVIPLRFGYIAEEKRAFKAAKPAETEEETAEGSVHAPVPVNFPTLDMPPFDTWHLPRGIGLQVGIALIGGYFLQMSATPALSIAGIILYTAARSLFTVQGAAAINFIQKRRNRRRVWRVVIPAALMLTPVPVIAGIFDQLSNLRGLRAPRQPKEE